MDYVSTNHGVAQGGLTIAPGKVGLGFLFSNDAYVVIPSSQDLNVGAGSGFTIEAWIKPDDVTSQHVIAEYNDGLGHDGVQLWFSITGYGGPRSLFANLIDVTGANHYFASAPDSVTTEYQHVGLTYDKSTGEAALYLNGAVVAQQNLGTFTPQTTYPLCLGARSSGPGQGSYFSGIMDEVSLYSRALTSSEIQSIYNAGTSGKCSSPMAPFMVTQPASQSVIVGEGVTFTAVAGGTAPLYYRWQFNGVEIPDASTSSLTLINLQLSQAGSYSVVVSNSLGSVTSSNAVLTVTPPPPCAAVPSGLVGWWKGEQGGQDELGTNHGTLVGNTTFAPAKMGQGFVFDGQGDAVDVGNSTSLQLQTFTIEAWVKRSNTSLASLDPWDSGAIFCYAWGGYGFGLRDNGTPFLSMVGYSAVYSTRAISDTGFHHVAVTKSGSTVVFYIDGIPESAPAYDPGFVFNAGAAIGARGQDFAGSFLGTIDEVSVYNRPLVPEEVQSIYAARSSGKCIQPTAPVVYQQPKDQTAEAGSNLSFTALASGTAPLTYHWLFNETNVLGGASSTLVLTNVQFSQAGSYAVVVSNAYGTVLSSNAVLTVTPPPPCGVPPIGLLHWWPAENNAQDIVGTNNGVLNGGVQYVPGRVGTAFSFNGTDADVRVAASPDLDIGLAQGMTIEGWINPSSLAAQQPLVEWSGANFQAQFWISVPTYGNPNPGSLYGNLRDTNGQDRWFFSQANVLTAEIWQHVALTYDKSTGLGGLYLNGKLMVEQNLGIFVPDTRGDLCFGLRASGAGEGTRYTGLMDEFSLYGRALAAEELKSIYAASSSGKCTGPTAPVVFQQPKDKTVEAGSDVTFSALASGTAPLSYRWLFNATNVLEAASSTLVLTNVQLSQAGTYTLQVSNAYGTALSSNAILTVTPPPPCVQPAADLVSWWRGDAGAWDELGGNSGVLSNNVSFGRGKVGQAFVFDGAGDAIQLGNPPNLQLQTLTMEGWIKRASTTKSSQGTPASGYLFAFGPGGYGLMMESNGGLDFGKVGGQMMVTSVRVSDTNYHHVAVTKSGSSVVIYLDGVRRTSFTYTYTFAFTNPAAIGARPDGLNSFWGNIDEFSIYKRALTATEVTSIYTAGVSGKCVTPVAPVLLAGLTDQVATVGDTVTLGVSLGGTPPFSYQWSYKGTAIEGQNSPSLTLTNVQMAQAGVYSVVVTNAIGATNSSAQLAVNFAPAVVRVLDTTAQAGRSITVPVMIAANGNENAIGFSLNFSPAQLTYETVSLGGGIFGGMLFVNANAAANGKLGVAVTLPPGATLSAGSQELALVTFKTAILTNTVVATVGFGDSPIGRQLSDAPGNSLPANYTAGNVTISAAELEGDVSPRPEGDHNVTITDWVLVGRYVALLDAPTNAMEFQHADCAPRATLGDGALSLIDWVQAGRYAARLDDLTLVGGPAGASSQGGGVVAYGPGTNEILRQIKVTDVEIVPGLQGNVAVQLVSQGDENAIGFSLVFDPAVVTYVSASPGADAPAASLTMNASQAAAGHVAVLLALPPGANFAAGTKEVVRLAFKLAASATGSSTLSLTDQPVRREVSDAFASSLPADYISGKVTVGALPALTIAHTDEVLLLSWPGWASNFVAQETYTLDSSSLNWTNVPAVPVQNNDQNVLQLPAPSSTRFFRLQLGN